MSDPPRPDDPLLSSSSQSPAPESNGATDSAPSGQSTLTQGVKDIWLEDVPPSVGYEDMHIPTSCDDAGCDVAVRNWRPKQRENVKGVAILFHGLHSHSGRFTRFASLLAQRLSLSVFAPDHILHGRSTLNNEGPVCDITDFNFFVEDARALIAKASQDHPGLPVIVFGHSMGSLVLMHALHGNTEAQQAIAGAIYCGLALNPGPSAAAPMGMKCLFCMTKGCCGLCLGGCLAGCGPMADGSVVDGTQLHHSKELFDKMQLDDLHRKAPVRNRMGFEVLKASRRVVSEGMIGAIEYPFLAIHGGSDDLCYPIASETLFAGAATPESDKELHIYPGLFHEVLNEYEREGYRADDDVLNFIVKHCALQQAPASPVLDEGKTPIDGEP